MKRLFFIIAGIIILFFLSCRQDNLIQVADIPDVPFVWCYHIEGASKTYVRALVEKDVFEERVFDENTFLKETDFDIRLKKNNALTADFDFFLNIDTSSFGGLTFIDTQVIYNYRADVNHLSPSIAGEIYELEIQHPNFQPMYARQKMPQKVPIKSAGIISTIPIFLGHRTNIQVTIEDPVETENYYQIQAINFPKRANGSLITEGPNLPSINIVGDDPEILDYEFSIQARAIYLADKSFNGQEKQISFWIEHFEPLPDNFRIVLRCISPEWYCFIETQISLSKGSRFESTLDNSLTQPYSLPFNIEGGFGLFGVATQELYKLD